MRVLVIPHDMRISGAAINALDLARSVRDRGHEVFVMACEGQLGDMLKETGLPVIHAPAEMGMRPSPSVVRIVRQAVRRHRIDVVHTFDYWATLEGYLGARGVPVVGTIMSMGSLPRYIPPVTLTLGFGDLYDEVRAERGPARAYLLEPPVDTAVDRRDLVDPDAFREAHGLTPGAPTLAIVSRLARSMKQESIERCIDAVGALDADLPGIQAVVAGGGSAEDELRARADKVNAGLGRRAVVLTGPLADPRAAYACADVVLGMGSSVLRGMALGVPAIVLGERGFTEPVRPDTIPVFDRFGFYGVGTGLDPAADPLHGLLRDLFADADKRAELAAWSHDFVVDRVALERQAGVLEEIFFAARAERRGPTTRAAEYTGTLRRTAAHKAAEQLRARRLRRERAAAAHG